MQADPGTTFPVDDGLRAGRHDRAVRRCVLAIIVAVIGIGATGFLGVRSATERRTGTGGMGIELVYPRVARPGLAVPWRLLLVAPDGFAGDIGITLSSSYVEAFDHNAVSPDPSSIERDDTEVTYVFDAPVTVEATEPETAGDLTPSGRFEMALDMSVEPGVQWKRTSVVTVTIGATLIDRFEITTWVLP